MRRGSEYEEDDNSRLRDWCWTLYPDTVGENKTRTWLEYLELKSRYTVYGIEICPESKKVHFQGYSEFKAPIAKKTLVNLGCGVHLEARRGTREQARDYCTGECDKPKIYPPNIDDPIIEMGVWKEEGIKGTDDWRKVEDILAEGGTFNRIANDVPKVATRYHKGLKATIEARMVNTKTVCTLIKLKGQKHIDRLIDDGFILCVYRNGKIYGLTAGARKIILEEDEPICSNLKARLISGRPTPVPVPGGDGERLWCPTDLAVWHTEEDSRENTSVQEQVTLGNTEARVTKSKKGGSKKKSIKITEEDDAIG